MSHIITLILLISVPLLTVSTVSKTMDDVREVVETSLEIPDETTV